MRSLQSAAPGRFSEAIGRWLRVGLLLSTLAIGRAESIDCYRFRNGLPLPDDATTETPRRNP